MLQPSAGELVSLAEVPPITMPMRDISMPARSAAMRAARAARSALLISAAPSAARGSRLRVVRM